MGFARTIRHCLSVKRHGSPCADIEYIRKDENFFLKESKLTGISVNEGKQLEFLQTVLPKFSHEYDPSGASAQGARHYRAGKETFGPFSALLLHCMVRQCCPRKIIEIGSGVSTGVLARACALNQKEGKPACLSVIDPYPSRMTRGTVLPEQRLIARKAQEIGTGFFEMLDANDILFIDSSHMVRTGGEVNFLYLEVLPRLRKGVIVHVHDIFFPREYPEKWIMRDRRCYTEQYLLRAFLTFNHVFEILWCNTYMYSKYPEKIRALIPIGAEARAGDPYFSSSFWMRRVS